MRLTEVHSLNWLTSLMALMVLMVLITPELAQQPLPPSTFPSSLSTFPVAQKGVRDILLSPISSPHTTVTFTVAHGNYFLVGSIALIDSEQFYISNVSGNSITATGAFNFTSSTPHLVFATVFADYSDYISNFLLVEVKAIESWCLSHYNCTGSGAPGPMVYPPAGIPQSVSGNSGWGSSLSLATTIGTPGLDTAIPTEKSVRTALSGLSISLPWTTLGDTLYYGSSGPARLAQPGNGTYCWNFSSGIPTWTNTCGGGSGSGGGADCSGTTAVGLAVTLPSTCTGISYPSPTFHAAPYTAGSSATIAVPTGHSAHVSLGFDTATGLFMGYTSEASTTGYTVGGGITGGLTASTYPCPTGPTSTVICLATVQYISGTPGAVTDYTLMSDKTGIVQPGSLSLTPFNSAVLQGAGSKVATVTGSPTSGHLATWDANGTLQDGGAPGSGSGGIITWNAGYYSLGAGTSYIWLSGQGGLTTSYASPLVCTTAKNLYFATSTSTNSDGGITATLYDATAASATTLVASIPANHAAGTFSDTTHTPSLTAGHSYIIQLANASLTVVSGYYSFGFQCQ